MDIVGIDISNAKFDAALLLAELPNIAEFTPKALAAFVGLSPTEHSSGTSVRRPGKAGSPSRASCSSLLTP